MFVSLAIQKTTRSWRPTASKAMSPAGHKKAKHDDENPKAVLVDVDASTESNQKDVLRDLDASTEDASTEPNPKAVLIDASTQSEPEPQSTEQQTEDPAHLLDEEIIPDLMPRPPRSPPPQHLVATSLEEIIRERKRRDYRERHANRPFAKFKFPEPK